MNCNDTCRPGFIPGPPAPNYASGCSLAENPTLKTYVLPASVGTDEAGQPYAPRIGEFRNAIVIYESNGNVYIYDSLGTPTLMEKGDYNGTGPGVPVPNINVVQETGTSETAVMSQNAVSVELSKTNDNVTKNSTNITTLQTQTTELSNKVDQLEEGGSGPEVVQATGASTTSVMSQNAVTTEVNKINTELTAVDTAVLDMSNNVSNLTTTTNELSNKVAALEAVDPTEVVQTTGQSTTAVMSQKAVTDIVGNISTLLIEVDTGEGVLWP